MNIWSELLKTALLGTDRSDLAPEAREQLADWRIDPDSDPSRALLEGSALLYTLSRAAHPFPIFGGTLPAVASANELTPVSVRSARHLNLILSGDYGPALGEYLRHLRQGEKRLPAENLPPLFEACLQNRELWEQLHSAVGERGRWLLTLNPDWRPLHSDPDPDHWETGDQEQRLAVLRHFRRHDPARAVDWLRKTWATESTEHRAAFLQELSTGLSERDEPFLEDCLQDRRKEVRTQAAALLSRLPASGLLERHWQRLGPVLSITEDGRVDLKLPAELSREARQDGIELRSPGYFGGGKKAGWVAQMVARIPPRRWEERFGLSPKQILHLFRASDWSSTLLPAVYEAIALHQDTRWAETVVHHWLHDSAEDAWQSPPAKKLLGNLSHVVFNQVAIRFLEHHPEGPGEDHALTYLLSQDDYEWQDRLSILVIRGLQQVLRESNAFFRQPLYYLRILRVAGFRAAPSLVDTFKSGWPYQSPGWSHWEKPVERFLMTLTFRREMIEELKKHPENE